MSDDAVEAVRRWEASGGGWEVVAEHGELLTVALLTCDRGETAGTVTGSHAALASYLSGRRRSEG